MPQDTQRTAELLETLLSDEELGINELDELLRFEVPEDLHLEYKHGKKLEETGKTPNRMIRRYVSGFANGAGGVLLVGVDEVNWCVTGCKAPGGRSLRRWASDCVSPIAGYFSPPPVFKKVDHPNGEVLVVAVARSPVLVPCYEGYHRPAYYLRMDDKTLKAPEYLVADLVLRRREHAYLAIPDFGIGEDYPTPEHDLQAHYNWQFRLQFRVENQGLARAENVRVGVV